MPFAELDGVRLHYRIDGDRGRPWLLFSNSLGTDLSMWDEQVAALSGRFRILRYDRRGHGLSDAPAGPYRLDDLGRDVLRLADHLDIGTFHLCGLSLGGLVAQWLALHAPSRIDRLVVCSTGGRIGTARTWLERIEQVRRHGLATIADATMRRWFSPGFLRDERHRVERIGEAFLRTSPQGYAACCGAMIDLDLRPLLPEIAAPTLAIAGTDDPVTAPEDLRLIADNVRDGRYAELPGRHLCNVESAEAFNRVVAAFLTGEGPQ